MEGVVLDVDLKTDVGILRASDGKRYSFKMAECVNGAPLPGNTVDFEEKEGMACDLFITKTPLRVWADWLFWFFFSFRGRISRDQFFMFAAGAFLLVPLFTVTVIWASFQPALILSGLIFVVYIKSCVIVKRFHDTDASGWLYGTLLFLSVFLILVMSGVLRLPFFTETVAYALIVLFAVLCLFALYLCFSKGNMGDNRYGKKPYTCWTRRFK